MYFSGLTPLHFTVVDVVILIMKLRIVFSKDPLTLIDHYMIASNLLPTDPLVIITNIPVILSSALLQYLSFTI